MKKKRPQKNRPAADRAGRGTYFCTIYYIPLENGFTAANGFTPEDLTPTTYPGLQNRRYPFAFLKAVRTEGFGRIDPAVGGKRYVAYDGTWRYEETPIGNRDNPLVEKVSCAVPRGAFDSGNRLRLKSAAVEEAFGNLDWVVDATGGGLAAAQIDLYCGEDDPHGRGEDIFRPAGTDFTRADNVIVTVRSGDDKALKFAVATLPWTSLRLRHPVAGLSQLLKGEFIPREQAFAHGGERLDVLHFVHRPLGFTCVETECFT